MKKYVIRKKDGSELHAVPAVYNTRKEAMLALLHYITGVIENTNDDCIGDPFDYNIEEAEVKDVSERITDFESARRALGRKANTDFCVVRGKFSESDVPLGSVAELVADIAPKHLESLIALNKLFTIAEAWNKEDDYAPDFSDWNQYKWFPWFKYDKDAAGFVFARTNLAPAAAYAGVASRLCFKSSARAAQFGKQFIDLYNKVFL